jgi:hypothetical protein
MESFDAMSCTAELQEVRMRKVETYEAVVENGQIKLADFVQLREHLKVYVVVPGDAESNQFYVGSPRLAQPEQAIDFVKDVSAEAANAGL